MGLKKVGNEQSLNDQQVVAEENAPSKELERWVLYAWAYSNPVLLGLACLAYNFFFPFGWFPEPATPLAIVWALSVLCGILYTLIAWIVAGYQTVLGILQKPKDLSRRHHFISALIVVIIYLVWYRLLMAGYVLSA